MYDYRPPRQNAVARLLTLLLIALAAASFVTSAFVPSLAVIPQTIGLVLLIPAIQLMTRYIATRYLYRIRPYDDGNTDLEIYAYRGGAHMQLVCRVGLEEITAATPLSAQNAKPPHGIRRYNYSPDIRPQSALVLSITNSDGDCEVLLCPDETMTAILQAPTSNLSPDAQAEAEEAPITEEADQ